MVSRFALHHFEDPAAALREMTRACATGGKVVVVDLAPPATKAAAFDAMDALRDPSHVHALPLEELTELFAVEGLVSPRTTSYRLEGELDELLGRSFPRPGDDEKIRALFRASVDDDALGIAAWRDGDTIRYGYPVAVLVGEKR